MFSDRTEVSWSIIVCALETGSKRQLLDHFLVSFFMWSLGPSNLARDFVHFMQLWGFSPKWILKSYCSLVHQANAFVHREQRSGFLPVWNLQKKVLVICFPGQSPLPIIYTGELFGHMILCIGSSWRVFPLVWTLKCIFSMPKCSEGFRRTAP